MSGMTFSNMSDGSFVILSQGQTIYEGGDEKVDFLSRKTRRSNKSNNKTIVVHPIFKSAALLIEEDPFWVKILEDASKGIFPKMYRYKDGILSFKRGSGIYTKEISQDDPDLCLRNVQDFMRSNGSYSERDNAIKTQEINMLRDEEPKLVVWKNIRSKKTKRILISSYVNRLGIRYGLSDLEISALINLTQLANSVGMINNTSVIMEKNSIADITVLCFDPSTRTFFIDPDVSLPKISNTALKKIGEELDTEETPETTTKMTGVNVSKSRLSDWCKFITVLGKRITAHDNLAEIEARYAKKAEIDSLPSIPEEPIATPQPKKKKVVITIKTKSKQN